MIVMTDECLMKSPSLQWNPSHWEQEGGRWRNSARLNKGTVTGWAQRVHVLRASAPSHLLMLTLTADLTLPHICFFSSEFPVTGAATSTRRCVWAQPPHLGSADPPHDPLSPISRRVTKNMHTLLQQYTQFTFSSCKLYTLLSHCIIRVLDFQNENNWLTIILLTWGRMQMYFENVG